MIKCLRCEFGIDCFQPLLKLHPILFITVKTLNIASKLACLKKDLDLKPIKP